MLSYELDLLEMGCLIHDIGKISVPTDILNRSGPLSTAEFEIIKTHPKIGFDIVQAIEFPPEINEMILQHHEKLDGSGYPNGLSGEEISKYSRILTVADIVDAIISNRPYRPALNIDIALSELTKNRGKYYDPIVVDACFTYFLEQFPNKNAYKS